MISEQNMLTKAKSIHAYHRSNNGVGLSGI